MTKQNAITAVSIVSIMIGTGIYLNHTSSNSKSLKSNIDDVIIPTVELPKVTIPTVNYYTKSFGVYTVVTPTLIQYFDINSTDVTKYSLDSLSNLIYVVLTESVQVGTVQTQTVQPKSVETIKIYDFDERIPSIMKFQKDISSKFKDKRNIERDKSVMFDNPLIHKWISIYNEYKSKHIDYISISYTPKVITEIKFPKTNEELNNIISNIEFFKLKSYNTVLLTFTCEEEYYKLYDLVKYIKSKDVKVFISYSGPEKLNTGVFIDPDKLSSYITGLSSISDGFIIAWRRTSAHLFEMDEPYMNFISVCARKGNSNIPIIGEIYYGNSYQFKHENRWGVSVNLPANCSAAMIVNFGFSTIDIPNIMNNFLPSKIPNFKTIPKIALVVGDRPYYLSRYNNGLTMEQNFTMKDLVEQEFLRNGCIGTITLSSDGSDGLFDSKVTDNMAEIKY